MTQDEYMTQFVLYGNPSDFRDKFIIRETRIYHADGRIEAQVGVRIFPDETAALKWGHENLEGAYVSRMEGDDPVIIGVWV